MTVLGWIISLILGIVKIFIPKKILFKRYHWIYGITVGPKWWGGCEMGLMFLRDWGCTEDYLNTHEFGHTFQNCILGPLFPFLVAIPSASRYWLRELFPKKDWAPYDGIWFEDAATQCGKFAHKWLSEREEKQNKAEN